MIAVTVVLTAGLNGFASAQAAGGHWTVAAVDGTALVVVDRGAAGEAKRGHPVVAGATVVTDDDSTVMLSRRGDSILLYPNSRVTIDDPSDGDPLGAMQSYGTLLYRMETLQSRKFEVRTPFLSATVTGTVFTVAVAADHATVSVAEGVVRVAPARGGRSDIVRAGNRASVSAANANQVTLEAVDPGDASFWNSVSKSGGASPGQSGDAGSRGGKGHGKTRGGGSKGGGSQGGDSEGGGSQDGKSRGDNSRGGGSQGGNEQGDE